MSTPAEQYTEVFQQSQEAVLNAVDSWTKTVQKAVGQLPSTPTQLDPNTVIDQVFDFAEKLLSSQREFAKNLVKTSTAVAESVTRGAQTVETGSTES